MFVTAIIAEIHPTVLSEYIHKLASLGVKFSSRGVNAHRRFFRQLSTIGLWSKMTPNGIIFTYGTETFNGVAVPFFAPEGVVPLINNFVSTDYSPTTGLNPGLGNSSKYIDTNWNPTNFLSYSSAQYSSYILTDADGSDGSVSFPIEGAATIGFNRIGLSVKLANFSNNTVWDCWNVLGDRVNTVTGANLGLVTGIRTANNDSRLFVRGIQVQSSSVNAVGTIPNLPFYIFGSNTSGVLNSPSRRSHGYDYIGPALSVSDEVFHNIIIDQFQQAYGRNIV